MNTRDLTKSLKLMLTLEYFLAIENSESSLILKLLLLLKARVSEKELYETSLEVLYLKILKSSKLQ